MKQQEIMDRIMRGQLVAVGMYWDGELTVNTWTDRAKGGASRTSHIAKEQVLPDKGQPFTVTRWLPDSEDPLKWKPAAKRGDKVVIIVTKMESSRVGVELRGEIHILEK